MEGSDNPIHKGAIRVCRSLYHSGQRRLKTEAWKHHSFRTGWANNPNFIGATGPYFSIRIVKKHPFLKIFALFHTFFIKNTCHLCSIALVY